MRGDAGTVVLHRLLGVDMLHADRVAHLALGAHRERVALALLERQHRVGRLQALREENNNRRRRLKNAHRTHTHNICNSGSCCIGTGENHCKRLSPATGNSRQTPKVKSTSLCYYFNQDDENLYEVLSVGITYT